MDNSNKKDVGDALSELMDALQDVGKPGGSNDPATTIVADNGEIINLGKTPTNTK